MKIRYALMSCNGEMDYLGYWPVTAAAWRKLGITPVLFFIPDSDVTEPPPADGIVHTLEPLADVEMGMQYLWARYWGTQFYPDNVVVISDVEMLPLSREYFVDQLENIPDNRYVHLNPCAYHPDCSSRLMPKDVELFTTMYHVARGSLFKEVLTLPEDWGQAAREVAPYCRKAPTSKCSYASVWDGDEIYSTVKIHCYEKQSIFYLVPIEETYPCHDAGKGELGKIIRTRRIDRHYSCVWDPALRKQDYYLDAHMVIPCTPESLELANLLVEGDPPPGKVQKCLSAEEDFLKRGEGFLARMIFLFRLFLIAGFGRNRSPLDATWSQLIITAMVRRPKTVLRQLFSKPRGR